MNFRTLDLNLLRVFDSVMAERNLTRAAEQLAMTQPAVSNALRRLKDAVGETLFTRAAFGVKPTAHADALWPEVRAALTQLREALDPRDYDPRTQPHTFHLAMADATSSRLLPALMRRLEADGALADLRVLPLGTRDPSKLLDQGEADIAIGHFPELVSRLSVQGAHAPLRHQTLYESEYICVMRQGHPAGGQGHADAGRLLRRPAPAGELFRPGPGPGRRDAGATQPQPARGAGGEPVLHRRAGGGADRPADGAATRLSGRDRRGRSAGGARHCR